MSDMISLNIISEKLTYNVIYIFTSGPKTLINNKGANINVGNIPGKLFYCEVVFSQWKTSIKC